MQGPSADGLLERRQSALQAEASRMLEELGLPMLLEGYGPARFAGSYVSGLMSWPEVDVMVLGSNVTADGVHALQARIGARPSVRSVECCDETGSGSPTGAWRDERHHLLIVVNHNRRLWRVDLSIWLHDDHANVTAWHEALRESITVEQRRAVLRLKDIWHRRPEYPDQVSGQDVYAAVLDADVRTPQEFQAWLARRRPPADPPV